jgi:hypothetical protein
MCRCRTLMHVRYQDTPNPKSVRMQSGQEKGGE